LLYRKENNFAAGPRQAPATKGVYLIAIAIAALVCAVSWPGFMSFDSVFALSQARHGITTAGYPPMVSYLWRLTELAIPGQGGMFALQNLLVCLGIAKFGRAVGASAWTIVAAIVLVAIAPATLGPMLVVWKDILFGGLLALGAGFSADFWTTGRRESMWVALIMLVLACTIRLNGVPAVLPLLFLIAWRSMRRFDLAHRTRALAAMAATSVVAILSVGLVVALSMWRLPGLERMTEFKGAQDWLIVGDLVGISVCSDRNVLPLPFYPAQYQGDILWLRSIYSPQHIQESFSPHDGEAALLESGFDHAGDLGQQWRSAVGDYPGCFLRHKLHLAKFLLGTNPGSVFYATNPTVFPNDLGVAVHESELTRTAVSWIEEHAGSPLARVWVFILAAAVTMTLALARRRLRPISLAIFSSGMVYLLVDIFLLPAADLRYQFWVVTSMVLTILSVMAVDNSRHAMPEAAVHG
jgi:hypothetical protein